MVMLKGKKKDILAYLQSPQYDMHPEDIKGIFPELLEAKESAVTEATKPTEVKDAEKALKLKSEEHYDIDGVWVIGAQDKVQFQWSSEYGGYSVGDENGTELYNGTDLKAAVKAYKKAINESVNEAEIKSDDEFKEYAFTVLQKAFGEDFDEAKAQEVVDGILGKVDGDYGKAAGILQASLG